MIPTGLITCILNPSSAKQKSIRTSSKLPSSKPQRKAVVRHGGGVASHHRLREVLTEAQHLQARSNSHNCHWSSLELPGQALSKGQVTDPLPSLRFPTVPPWGDNHGYASASLLIFFNRRDLMQHSRHNLSSFVSDSMAFSTKKHSVHYCVDMLWRQGHDSFISCSRWKKIQKKNTIKIIKEETPLSEITIQQQIP